MIAMMRTFVLSCLALASIAAASSNQNLVPAQNMGGTDSQGFLWDVQQDGSINDGTSDCFDGALHLMINGQHFQSMQPMQTADGSELVLQGQLAGLQLTRRLRLFTQQAAMRYVDIFENSSGSAVQVQVSYNMTLGGSCSQTVTEDGTVFAGGQLPEDRLGITMVHSPGSHRPSVMWQLVGQRSKVQPQIQANNNRHYTINFSITVPANGSVALLHTVAQRRFQTMPNGQQLDAEFAVWMERDWTRDLPSDVRRAIINGRTSGMSFGDGAGALSLEALEVDTGALDVLAMGEATRVQGTANAASIAVVGRYGRAEVALDDIAAVVGEAHSGGRSAVLLRDGQVLTGELEVEELRFTLLSGMSVDLDVASLDRLVRAEETTSLDDLTLRNDEPILMITTTDGQRLRLDQASDETIVLVTAWARLEVPAAEIIYLGPASDGALGWVVALHDGSRFGAYLGSSSLTLPSALFGEVTLAPSELVAVTRIVRNEDDEIDPEETLERQPHIRLAGEQVLVGELDLPVLRIQVDGQVLPLAPDQVRLLEQQDSANQFQAELWGQDQVRGHVHLPVVPIRSRGQNLLVPLHAISEIVVPVPRTPEGLRERLAGLIEDLGHRDWRRRDAAADQLRDLGPLAYAAVQDAYDSSLDPEVRYRAEQLLPDLEP